MRAIDRRIFVLFLLMTGLGLAGSALAGDTWPGLRGPHFDGAVPEGALFPGDEGTLKIAWKRPLGSGYSAVVVGDGRAITLFFGGDQDFAAAFDVETGAELWRYAVAEAYKGHDGSHDGPIATPALGGGRVFGLGPRGQLFALDAASGKELWKTDLAKDHTAEGPYYGFATSPLVAGDVVVVEIGAGEGKSVAGFRAADGHLLWTAGDRPVEYHTPVLATLGGRQQVVVAVRTQVSGLDPLSGEILWSYEHEGDETGMGGETIIPVPAGPDQVLLANKIDSSFLLEVKKEGEGFQAKELWSSKGLARSYVQPVYHEGFFYGMANRIFTCVDGATGETRWRSREPGDGFPTLVGKHLVILIKPGTLHVAKASPEGYEELARLDLFTDQSWSAVAYADGHLFARSMGEIARIDPVAPAAVAAVAAVAPAATAAPWVAATPFGRFLAQVEAAPDKGAVIDAYLAAQSSYPIVEPSGAVHFVYRGEAKDVGIVGDMIGSRREDPMVHVAGTDLFHYSVRLEPDASLAYGFIPDFGETIPDPRRPEIVDGVFGKTSWLTMPAWLGPDFDPAAEPRGTLETVEWVSAVREGKKRQAQVYLPAGYRADGQERYPVAYIHNGKDALEEGATRQVLDRFVGETVAPLIAVFILRDEENPREDAGDAEGYVKLLTTELVPLIDQKYRTLASGEARASVGQGGSASLALEVAFRAPEIFGRAGAQSPILLNTSDLGDLVPSADEHPLVIYHGWGRYHLRGPHEGWDMVGTNAELHGLLRQKGYRPAGGETPEGFGWIFWRARTPDLLRALFPKGR